MKNESQWESAFLGAVSDALGRMALLDVDVSDAETVGNGLGEKALGVTMDLRGDPGWRVSVRITQELAIVWAGALTGLGADELDENDISDGASELLNMVAGASKTTLGDAGIEFELGIPEVETTPNTGQGDGGSGSGVFLCLKAGEYPIEIKLIDR